MLVLQSRWAMERLAAAKSFLERALPKALPHFADGEMTDPRRMKLSLRIVKSDTHESDLFRVATLTWSVPVSMGFGRRIRYPAWDEGHDRLAGIVALGDPVYNLSVRDNLIDVNISSIGARICPPGSGY